MGIVKASAGNTDIENYNFLKQGMNEAEKLLNEPGLETWRAGCRYDYRKYKIKLKG